METAEYDKMFAVEDRHFWFVGKRAILAAVLERHLGRGGERAILDVGCGTGANLDLLAGYGASLGIDLRPEALAYCARRGLGTRVRQGSATALPFDDGSFDLVTIFDVLYHRDVDAPAAIAEAWRVLRPGGYLLITDSALPWLESPHDRAVWGRERFTRARLSNLVTSGGFELVRVTFWNFLLLPVVASVRMLERLRRQTSSSVSPELPAGNAALTRVLRAEAALIGRGVDLPIGSSLLCLARRAGPRDQGNQRGSQ